MQDAGRAGTAAGRIEVQLARGAADDRDAGQLHAERRDQPLLAARFGVDEQQAEARLDRVSRHRLQALAQPTHEFPRVGQPEGRGVLDHILGDREALRRQAEAAHAVRRVPRVADHAARHRAERATHAAGRQRAPDLREVEVAGSEYQRRSLGIALRRDLVRDALGRRGARGEPHDPRAGPRHRGDARAQPPTLSSGKSSSRNSPGTRSPSACAASACRSSTRRIFPEIVFGRSANCRRRMRL